MMMHTLFLPIFTAAKDKKHFNKSGITFNSFFNMVQGRRNIKNINIFAPKVLFIFRCSKNWQKKSVHHHLLTNDGAQFFWQFLLQRKMKSTLISLGKINLFEPRLSQASMVTVEIRIKTFIVKNPNMGCFLCVPYSGTLVHKQIREVP